MKNIQHFVNENDQGLRPLSKDRLIQGFVDYFHISRAFLMSVGHLRSATLSISVNDSQSVTKKTKDENDKITNSNVILIMSVIVFIDFSLI